MSESDELFPETPKLYSPIPAALRLGDRGFDAVAGKYKETLREMPADTRRYACLFWLAHTGHLKDQEGRIWFDLTPAELAQWYDTAVGEEPAPNELKAAVEALKKRDLIKFCKQRECRVAGNPASTFRFVPHVFPVPSDI